MALISCPNCGKSVSDKALACPHCGTPIAQAQNAPVQQPVYNTPSAPKKSHTGIIIASVIIGVVVICSIVVAVLIPVLKNNSPSSTESVSSVNSAAVDNSTPQNNNVSDNTAADNNVTPPPSVNVPQEKTYDITLNVECRQNLAVNKYNVDIIIDGKTIATLPHGETQSYKRSLTEGTHEIEFRINHVSSITHESIYNPDKENTFSKMYIDVSKNDEFSYYVKLTSNNSIEVTPK